MGTDRRSCIFQVIQLYNRFLSRTDRHVLSTTSHTVLSFPIQSFLTKKKKNSSSNWAREERGPVALIRQWTYLHLMWWTSVYLDAQTGVLTLSATQTPSLPRSFISRGRTRRASTASSDLYLSLETRTSWTYQCPAKCHTGRLLQFRLAGARIQTAAMLFVLLKAHGDVLGSL